MEGCVSTCDREPPHALVACPPILDQTNDRSEQRTTSVHLVRPRTLGTDRLDCSCRSDKEERDGGEGVSLERHASGSNYISPASCAGVELAEAYDLDLATFPSSCCYRQPALSWRQILQGHRVLLQRFRSRGHLSLSAWDLAGYVKPNTNNSKPILGSKLPPSIKKAEIHTSPEDLTEFIADCTWSPLMANYKTHIHTHLVTSYRWFRAVAI
ncbi:hypothetical protein LX32DRAFT_444656 [Colletotrichum zoysiae]|uniref:Uncharacterized protein n=1 Tax=Colletotrichum zoysiae TaxID=1216348 RepID=A0AAD9HTH3_9PEZI|nr:hypothetical protein LX32DRAFT_444656 [Colletotrichum zoysiae]